MLIGSWSYGLIRMMQRVVASLPVSGAGRGQVPVWADLPCHRAQVAMRSANEVRPQNQ